MSLEENKALVRRYLEEVWNSGDLTVVDEIVAADFVFHRSGGDLKGPEALKQYYNVFRAGFPDLHFSFEEMVAKRDLVFTHWTMTGTQKGEIMGIPATGKKVRLQGVSLTRLAGGRLTENTTFWDRLTLLQQLGVK